MEKGIDEMSVKDLKGLIAKAGLSVAGITEKSELREKAREAQARLDQKKEPLTQSDADWTMRYEYENGASDENAELVVVLMHGIGADGDNLVPLGSALGSMLKGKKTKFVYPGAPSGYWFPLNPIDWMRSLNQGEGALAKLIRTEFSGLAECRRHGQAMIQALQAKSPKAKFVLGGFSQGAMTSTDMAIHAAALHNIHIDAIIHLSGAPIDIDAWSRHLQKIQNKPKIYISHGQNDMLLPFPVANWSNEIFTKAGCEVSFQPHHDSHIVGPVDPIAHFLLSLFIE